MTPEEQSRFDELYKHHLRSLKLQGYTHSTIDVYSRAVRRLSKRFDCVPDQLSIPQLEQHFSELVDSHSWATVRVDRNGLQFFWKHILKQDWKWVEIIKPPKIQSLPDVLTMDEVSQLICAAKMLRYRVFILVTYSMGLRLSETLSLQVGDIDRGRMQVHIRRGKGCKDRFVPLPQITLLALESLWRKHRHPRLIFPNPVGSPERIRQATSHMNLGGTQKAFKVLVDECGIKKRSQFIPFVTASPPTCLSSRSISVTSRGYSAIALRQPPHATPISQRPQRRILPRQSTSWLTHCSSHMGGISDATGRTDPSIRNRTHGQIRPPHASRAPARNRCYQTVSHA